MSYAFKVHAAKAKILLEYYLFIRKPAAQGKNTLHISPSLDAADRAE